MLHLWIVPATFEVGRFAAMSLALALGSRVDGQYFQAQLLTRARWWVNCRILRLAASGGTWAPPFCWCCHNNPATVASWHFWLMAIMCTHGIILCRCLARVAGVFGLFASSLASLAHNVVYRQSLCRKHINTHTHTERGREREWECIHIYIYWLVLGHYVSPDIGVVPSVYQMFAHCQLSSAFSQAKNRRAAK